MLGGVRQLRRLYLKARYGECATSQDAAAADVWRKRWSSQSERENVSREAWFMKTTVKWASAPGFGRSGLENLPGPQVPLGKGLPAHEPVYSAGRGAQPGGWRRGQPGAGPDAAAAGDAGAAARSRQTVQVPGGQEVPLTLYEPEGAAGKLPCLVYFHGGGVLLCRCGIHPPNVMDYSLGTSCKVVFVHYRTSERAAFPLPFEDCRQALQFVWEHSAQLGHRPGPDRRGRRQRRGALAAACALWARDQGGPRCAFRC